MDRPNLFIVGKEKSGTTALHHFLAKHPDIFMTDPKEPRYFCDDFQEEALKRTADPRLFPYRDEESYLRLFKDADAVSIAGESSPIYLDSKTAAKNIKRFAPDAKIIVMLREPVSYLYSLHAQYYYTYLEDEPDFKKALALQDQRAKGERIPRDAEVPSLLQYFQRVRYAEQIERFLAEFPEDQVKIILFDDFKKDNKSVYKEVLGFLGVDEGFSPDFELLNVNRSARFRAIKRLIDQHPGWWRWTRKVPLIGAAAKATYGLFVRRAPRVPLDDETKRDLRRRFKPEVEKVGALIKEDLVQRWKYGDL